MTLTSLGKLPNLVIGKVYGLRQMQGNWFSPLPRNICAEDLQGVGGAGGMKGQSWGFIDQCLMARTENSRGRGMSRAQELIRKDPGATSCGPGRVMLGSNLELAQRESELA